MISERLSQYFHLWFQWNSIYISVKVSKMPFFFFVLNVSVLLGLWQTNEWADQMYVLYAGALFSQGMCVRSVLGNIRNLWYFLFLTSNLFVILNICFFIVIESLGSEFMPCSCCRCLVRLWCLSVDRLLGFCFKWVLWSYWMRIWKF